MGKWIRAMLGFPKWKNRTTEKWNGKWWMMYGKMKWGNESLIWSDFQNGRTEQPKNEM
jgi:hypothetical protein